MPAFWKSPHMLLIAKRLNRDIEMLKHVEAIRHYAAGHNDALPASLDDITGFELSDDAVTGKPFAYRRSGSNATLESIPSGDAAKYAVRIELRILK